jgi:C-terminal processing protease CtpA/Prc
MVDGPKRLPSSRELFLRGQGGAAEQYLSTRYRGDPRVLDAARAARQALWGKKPVYVLTSARTFSGGEDLACTLQTHQRAIVVGEITAGGAHPTAPYALDFALHVTVPWGRSINPITNSNWEGTGVQPDIASAAELALERAMQALARPTTA